MKGYLCFLVTVSLGMLFSQITNAVDIGVHIVVDDNLVTATTTQDDLRESMDLFVLETNEFYEESGVDINLVLENLDFRDISNNGTVTNPGTLLNNIENENGVFNGIFVDADRFGADYIVAIVEVLDNVCGRAVAVNTTQQDIAATDRAYAVSRLDCGSDTFAHELGHLMGLAHGDLVTTCTGNTIHQTALVDYARGWAEGDCDGSNDGNEFGTIMVGNWINLATGWTNINDFKIPLFSSPDLTNEGCGDDEICGDANTGDAVRALNENRVVYASHEARDVDLLTYQDSSFSSCLASSYANTEVLDLTGIACISRDIGSIEGIQQLNMLGDINLSDNRIVNVSPLASLSQTLVTSINLDGNDTALCHELEQLESRYPGRVIVPDSCLNIGALIASFSFSL